MDIGPIRDTHEFHLVRVLALVRLECHSNDEGDAPCGASPSIGDVELSRYFGRVLRLPTATPTCHISVATRAIFGYAIFSGESVTLW